MQPSPEYIQYYVLIVLLKPCLFSLEKNDKITILIKRTTNSLTHQLLTDISGFSTNDIL